MSPMREAMSPQVKAALEQCRWMIRKGSKSFSLAINCSIRSGMQLSSSMVGAVATIRLTTLEKQRARPTGETDQGAQEDTAAAFSFASSGNRCLSR